MPPSAVRNRNTSSRNRTFLPAALKLFFRRRAVEAGGIALFAVAAALAVSLATYELR